LHELDDRQLGLPTTEAGVATQQLPGVDVAGCDKLRQPPSPLDATAMGERGREHPRTPVTMQDAALLDDLA
jgi:hypothetical protein